MERLRFQHSVSLQRFRKDIAQEDTQGSAKVYLPRVFGYEFTLSC